MPAACGTALRVAEGRLGWWSEVTAALRPIADPFVAAAPAGARVRTRSRVSAQDEAVLLAVGRHLGSLAGRDLAVRCAQGHLGKEGKAVSRAARKRALTAECSSRWAGAITRTSEDQHQRAEQNLQAERSTLRARIRRIEARLAVPVGGKDGRTRGYATAAERHSKMIRLKTLEARLAHVQRRLDSLTPPTGQPSTGCGPCGTIIPRRPATTRQRW